MSTARRYPIDFESLSEGDSITEERVAEITGEAVGSRAVGLEMLRFISLIETYFRDNSIPLMARQSGGSIIIIAGNQMVDTVAGRQDRALRSIARGLVTASRVDTSQLDQERRARLDQTVYRGTRLVDAERVLRREAIEAHPTPKLDAPAAWAKEEDTA